MLRKRWKCEVNEEERCGQCLYQRLVQKGHKKEQTLEEKEWYGLGSNSFWHLI